MKEGAMSESSAFEHHLQSELFAEIVALQRISLRYLRRIETIIMSTQTDVDELTTLVQGYATAVDKGVADIAAEIAALDATIAAGDTVDTTALSATLTAFGASVAALTTLDETNTPVSPSA